MYSDMYSDMNMYNALYVKLLTESAMLPTKNGIGDAGFDVYVDRIEDFDTYIKVYSGIAIEPGPDTYYELVPRSSTYKKGLIMYNSIGIIDRGYRGEIVGILYKTLDFKSFPEIGDRLLQLIPRIFHNPEVIERIGLSDTTRASKGFGSSGT